MLEGYQTASSKITYTHKNFVGLAQLFTPSGHLRAHREHVTELLSELGYTAHQISALQAQRII